MKRAFVPVLLLVAACSTSTPSNVSQPGHGALAIQIVPNPIVAQHVNGNEYTFPFDVIIRETGGHPVTITRVSADVNALGGIHVASESYDATKIASLGYSTRVPANGEIRYHFAPQHAVADDRLFGNVTAVLTVDGIDDTGTATQAGTSVTVTR